MSGRAFALARVGAWQTHLVNNRLDDVIGMPHDDTLKSDPVIRLPSTVAFIGHRGDMIGIVEDNMLNVDANKSNGSDNVAPQGTYQANPNPLIAVESDNMRHPGDIIAARVATVAHDAPLPGGVLEAERPPLPST